MLKDYFLAPLLERMTSNMLGEARLLWGYDPCFPGFARC